MATWLGEGLSLVKHSFKSLKPVVQRGHFESQRQMRMAPYQALSEFPEMSAVMSEDEYRQIVAEAAAEAEIPFELPVKPSKKAKK